MGPVIILKWAIPAAVFEAPPVPAGDPRPPVPMTLNISEGHRGIGQALDKEKQEDDEDPAISDGAVECKSQEIGFFKEKDKVEPMGPKCI